MSIYDKKSVTELLVWNTYPGRGIIIGEAIFSRVIETSKVSFSVRLFSAVFGAGVYYLVITAVLQAGLNTSDLKLFSAAVVAVVRSLPHLKTVKKGKVKSDAQPE